MEEKEHAMSITFSQRESEIRKLAQLTKKTGKTRSQLLSEWLDQAYSTEFPQPISLEEGLARR